jgi:nucleoside-diphosphate-sugar epimerase
VCGYSPRLRLDLTVNLLTLQALVNKKITVFGGAQFRPNIHIQDMTDLYVKCLAYPDKKISGKILNAGYENYSVLAIARMVKDTIGDTKIQIVTLPTNDKRSYRVDSSLLKKELGFAAKHTVEEAVMDLYTAYKQGKIPRAFEDIRYFNIKTMQTLGRKISSV